jgi:hypothetical protein
MRLQGRIRVTAKLLGALCLPPLVTACDLGPDGPATVTGRITGHPALGAVVLEVTWRGIVGFEGAGSTQAYSAASPTSPDSRRVVLVAPDISELPFAVDVESPLAVPTVTIVEAVNIGNLPVDVSRLRVVFDW